MRALSALIPGHLCPWRRRVGPVRYVEGEGGVAWRGVGSGHGGPADVGWAPLPSLRSPPIRRWAEQPRFSPTMCAERAGGGQARRPGHSDAAPRPDRRPPAQAHTLPPVRPGPLSPAPRSTATAPHVAVGPPAPPAARPRQPCLSGAACAAGAGSPCLTPAGQAGR